MAPVELFQEKMHTIGWSSGLSKLIWSKLRKGLLGLAIHQRSLFWSFTASTCWVLWLLFCFVILSCHFGKWVWKHYPIIFAPSGQANKSFGKNMTNSSTSSNQFVRLSIAVQILVIIWGMSKTIVESINIDLIPGVHKCISSEGAWDVDEST